MIRRYTLERGRLTVGDTLRIPVRLGVVDVGTDKLKIDFVFDVGHHDEGSNDTLALAGRQSGADLAVPYVKGRGQQCANGAFGHGKSNTTGAVLDGISLRLPVDLGVVTEVLVNGLDIVKVVELVGALLAHRVRNAGIKVGRHGRVASTQAESTDTAVSVD